MQNESNSRESYLRGLEQQIALGDAVDRLLSNTDFVLFKDHFFDGFIITNGVNYHSMNAEKREKAQENIVARGVFIDELHSIMNQAGVARDMYRMTIAAESDEPMEDIDA